ncbi:MAG: hypothetical protein AAFQ39_03005 [Pseudomonadota bacterium]
MGGPVGIFPQGILLIYAAPIIATALLITSCLRAALSPLEPRIYAGAAALCALVFLGLAASRFDLIFAPIMAFLFMVGLWAASLAKAPRRLLLAEPVALIAGFAALPLLL